MGVQRIAVATERKLKKPGWESGGVQFIEEVISSSGRVP